MQKNMGTIDRTIRILVAVAVALLWWSGIVSGTLAIVLGVFAGLFLLTSMVSFCPLYAALGLSTCKRN